MHIVRLGKKGQLSIPRKVMSELGLEGESLLMVDTTDDGAILLRPAGVFPIEMYSDERVQTFLEGTQVSDDLNEQVRAKIAALRAEGVS